MASVLKVDKLDPQSGTALEIGTSGDTVSIPSGATLDISASTLTPPATMPASSGINFTALNATNLGSGTVPTARLGTGSASSSTILYGDNTWAAPGGVSNMYMTTQVSRDMTAASGTQDVTGFGFDPTHIIVHGEVEGAIPRCVGQYSAAIGNRAIATTETNTQYLDTNYAAIFFTGWGATAQKGALSLITDGFRITWVKAGSPTGTAYMFFAGWRAA